jgi:predicted nucleic acid-binding protein
VYAVDSSFVIDVLRGDPAAKAKAERLEAAGGKHAIAAPAVAEVLMGAYCAGGLKLRRALEVIESLSVMDIDGTVALEAASMGADLMRAGTPLALPDLLVAASAKLAGQTLLSRDGGFARIPGLAVERY